MIVRRPFPLRNTETGGTPPAPTPAPPAPPVPAPPIPAPAPPPAAAVVIAGLKTEREAQLEAERDAALANQRAAETRAAETEKNFQDYRAAVEKPRPTPAPKKDFLDDII